MQILLNMLNIPFLCHIYTKEITIQLHFKIIILLINMLYNPSLIIPNLNWKSSYKNQFPRQVSVKLSHSDDRCVNWFGAKTFADLCSSRCTTLRSLIKLLSLITFLLYNQFNINQWVHKICLNHFNLFFQWTEIHVKTETSLTSRVTTRLRDSLIYNDRNEKNIEVVWQIKNETTWCETDKSD